MGDRSPSDRTSWLRSRWVPIVVLAVILFAVNVAARLVTKFGEFAEESEQLRIGAIATSGVGLILVGAAAWWAIRYPFGRVLGDLGAAAGIAAALSVTVAPMIAGAKPFAEGLGNFVGQILLFLGLAGLGVFIGFVAVVALGKDWKSRGLRLYEQNYRARPHRTARG
jgi:hypothetical protein